MAKKLKIKLPKRIGGLKIPKTVRKGPIAKFLNSGPGQIVIAGIGRCGRGIHGCEV